MSEDTTPDAPDVFALNGALEGLMPYARSRIEDMHENAIETHGEGKAYRCACYRNAVNAYATALEAVGMTEAAATERDWLAQMARACATDPGPTRNSCSWSGLDCFGEEGAHDLVAIEKIAREKAVVA